MARPARAGRHGSRGAAMLAAAAAVAGVLAGAAAAAAALGPAPGALRAAHAGARRRAPGIGRCGPPPAAWPAERGGWRPLRAGEATAERRLYEVLGVEQNAEVRSIKKAYYNMARDCHPDKFPGDEAMRARFQEVAEAYQTLADPVRRQQYDLGGLAALAYLKTNATRLFGPPPWRVMIGRTDHWMWEPDQREYTISIIAGAIPNGIAGVTVQVVCDAIEEAYQTRVAVLLDRVSEEQAKDTVAEIEEFGLAVKAEPIEDEREGEQESPLQYFRRIQRELGMAAESLRSAAIEVPLDFTAQKNPDEDLDKWIETVKSVRSELRAAAKGLEEFKIKQTGPAM